MREGEGKEGDETSQPPFTNTSATGSSRFSYTPPSIYLHTFLYLFDASLGRGGNHGSHLRH